jgi:hypothetical protein
MTALLVERSPWPATAKRRIVAEAQAGAGPVNAVEAIVRQDDWSAPGFVDI